MLIGALDFPMKARFHGMTSPHFLEFLHNQLGFCWDSRSDCSSRAHSLELRMLGSWGIQIIGHGTTKEIRIFGFDGNYLELQALIPSGVILGA